MRIVSWLGASLALVASLAAHADPLGFYVGAGVGESTVQSTQLLPVQVYEHPTGWKVFAGWRPIQMFGAELEYVDLGSKDSSYSPTLAEHASASAVAAFAVGYLPQPIPFLDFYGKVGVASLRTNTSTTYSGGCPAFAGCPTGGVQDQTGARFAYAAGIELKFGAPAVRLEYQGFATSGGDQSLVSLDVLWNF
ncbi:MAG: outer membrane beta-barrel protein [Steroidobacteraceae bacterium]